MTPPKKPGLSMPFNIKDLVGKMSAKGKPVKPMPKGKPKVGSMPKGMDLDKDGM